MVIKKFEYVIAHLDSGTRRIVYGLPVPIPGPPRLHFRTSVPETHTRPEDYIGRLHQRGFSLGVQVIVPESGGSPQFPMY